jgi:hypothetical protein
MNTKKPKALSTPEDFLIMALTRTWPGSWGSGTSIKAAKKRLRQEQSLTGIPIVYYLVHKDTSINGMGMFTHPEEHPPICLGE